MIRCVSKSLMLVSAPNLGGEQKAELKALFKEEVKQQLLDQAKALKRDKETLVRVTWSLVSLVAWLKPKGD